VRNIVDYIAELPVATPVMIESGLLKVGNTSVTSFSRMRDSETGELAATAEGITVYFDLKARSKTPLPADLKAAMEARLVSREQS
jgi:acyl-CoA thioesterase FadM